MKITSQTLKKITSLFLSLVFVLSTFAAVDFSQSTAIEAKADSDDYYMFAYFTGNANSTVSSGGNQAIRFALSTDGRNFKALNDNNPTINQTGGTLNVRDPYLFKGADGYYYIIGTDLDCITMGWWGNQPQMVIWRSADLVNWDHETYINAAQICGLNNNQVYRTWAPEVFYDESSGKYMVYFAFAADGYNSTNMYYMLTDDLLDQSKYSQPQQLYRPYDDPANPCYQNNNKDCIDADITYQDGTYYMFYKDEGASTVCLATSTELTGPYSYVGKCATTSETANIEGCQVYKIGNDYHLVADRFSAAGRFAIYNLGSDLSAITASDGSIAMDGGSPISTVDGLNGFQNISPRHGSIIHINKTQYDALITKYGISTDDDIRYCFDREYTAENSWHYDGLLDASGYYYDLMTNTGGYSYVFPQTRNVSIHNAVMFVNDAAVKQMFTDNKSWSVSFNAVVNETHNTTLFALFSGDTPTTTTDWIRFLDNGKLVLYYDGAYHEVGSTTITTSVNYKYDITYNGSKIVVYQNGKEVISSNLSSVNFDITKPEAHIAFGWTDTVGATGIWGSYSNLRFRNRAITPAEVDREYTDNASHQVYRYNEGTNPTVDGRDQVTYNNPQTSTTYSGKNGNSFTISSWVNIGAAKNNDCTLFEFGSGGTGDDKNYLGMLETGEFRYCWSEGSTAHYVDINTGYNFAVNTWYFLQINVVPDGNIQHFKIWVNGELAKDQFDNYNAMNLYDHSPIHMLSQTSFPLYFGKGHAYWTADGYNLIDDFRVYNRALDPDELYSEIQIEEKAAVARDYVRANLENYNVDASANKANRKAYHYTNEAVGGYNNVLAQTSPSDVEFSSNSNEASTAFHGQETKGNSKYNIFWPKQIVLMYDGVNTPAIPAVAEILSNNGNQTMTTLVINEDVSPNWRFAHYWTGYIDSGSNAWRTWPGTSMPYNFADDPYNDGNGGGGYEKVNDNRSHIGYRWGSQYDWSYGYNNTKTSRFFWNRCRYIGTPNTTSYYEHESNLQVRSWQGSEQNLSTVNHDMYIINYKPIYDILKYDDNNLALGTKVPGTSYNLKSLYKLFVKDNENNYTEDSLNQFYLAAYKVLTCNPVEYSEATYRNDFEGTVTLAANEIKEAVAEFNKINLVQRANCSYLDSACTDANAVVDTLGTNTQAYTTTSINALKQVVDGLTYAPDDGTPYRPNLAYSTHQDSIDLETLAVNNAITALKSIANFNALDTAYTSADTLLKGLDKKAPVYRESEVKDLKTAVNDASYESYTPEQRLDTAASEAQKAITSQATAISDAQKNLTEISGVDFSTLEEVISIYRHIDNEIYNISSAEAEARALVLEYGMYGEDVKYGDSTIKTISDELKGTAQEIQNQLDSAAGLAVGNLNEGIRKYTISLESGEFINDENAQAVAANGKVSGEVTTVDATHYSASANTLLVITAAVEDTAWYMSYDSVDIGENVYKLQYQGYGEQLNKYALGNMKIYAHQRNSSTPNKLTINRAYSDNNTAHGVQCIDFVSNTYVLPEAPAIPYYSFVDYTYNGVHYAPGQTITDISKDITVIANYSPAAQNSLTVKITDSKGGLVYNDSARYNQKIEVSDDDADAWIQSFDGGASWRLFYIGSSFTYYVSESSEIKGITSSDADYAKYVKGLPVVSLNNSKPIISAIDTTVNPVKNKITFNGQLISGSADVSEYGVLIGKGTMNEDDLVIENSGTQDGYKILRAKSTRLVGANQFTIGVNTNMTGEYYYRAYAMYHDGSKLVTVYGDVLTDTIS